MASIDDLHVITCDIGMGKDHSYKQNQLTSYTTYHTKSIALDPTQTPPTEQYIFDSSATDAFYQPPTTLAFTL